MWIPEKAKKVFNWKIFSVYQWEQEMFDWTIKIFERLKRNDSIDVIAVSENNEIFILEEQHPWRRAFFWLVWWTCEDWEAPIETAKRELLEETWLESDDWELFWSYAMSSKIDYKSNIFIARWCKNVKNQNLDAWEKIRIKKVKWKEFLYIITNPKFRVWEFALEVLREIFLWKEKELKEKIFKNKW